MNEAISSFRLPSFRTRYFTFDANHCTIRTFRYFRRDIYTSISHFDDQREDEHVSLHDIVTFNNIFGAHQAAFSDLRYLMEDDRDMIFEMLYSHRSPVGTTLHNYDKKELRF